MDRTIAPFVVDPFVIGVIKANVTTGLVVQASDGTVVATFGNGPGSGVVWAGAQTFQDQITTEAIVRDVRAVTSAAGTTALDATDHVLVVTGTTTQTLTLVACATGRELILKNRSTGIVTVNRAGSDTIDGTLTTFDLAANDSVMLIGNGTDWTIN